MHKVCNIMKEDQQRGLPIAGRLYTLLGCNQIAIPSCQKMCSDMEPLIPFLTEKTTEYFCSNQALYQEEKQAMQSVCANLGEEPLFNPMCTSVELIHEPDGCRRYVKDAVEAYYTVN